MPSSTPTLGGAGEVRVTLSVPEATLLRLGIADQGVGLPEGFDLAGHSGSLGMRLIANLTRQLGADIKATLGNPGTVFSISTPFNPHFPDAHTTG
jgi:two-component sensor histidine kinase